jgi:hypothetical protein
MLTICLNTVCAGLQHFTIRQNKETVDAKEISPVMQQFLYQGSERGFRYTHLSLI